MTLDIDAVGALTRDALRRTFLARNKEDDPTDSDHSRLFLYAALLRLQAYAGEEFWKEERQEWLR